jgi:hypothetical protein
LYSETISPRELSRSLQVELKVERIKNLLSSPISKLFMAPKKDLRII